MKPHYKAQKHICSIEQLNEDLRLLATDGFFVPIPTCAEVLFLGSLNLLQSTHVGTVRGKDFEGVGRRKRHR